MLSVVAVERDVRIGPDVPLSPGRRAAGAHAQALLREESLALPRRYASGADGREHALVRRGRQAGGWVDGLGRGGDLRELLLTKGVDGRDVLSWEVRGGKGV